MVSKKEAPIKRNGTYYIPNGKEIKRYIAVTEILGHSIDKPALRYWTGLMAARAALEDPSLDERAVMAKVGTISASAARRGSTVHSLTEAADTAGTNIDIKSLPPELRGYLEAFNSFRSEYKPKLIFNEQIIFNDTVGYAGTLDRVYEIDNKWMLVDIKTSKDFYKDQELQLSAYRNSEFIYTKDKKTLPFEGVEGAFILLLGENGKYAIKHAEDNFPVFLSVMEIYRFFNSDKLKEGK